MIIIKKIEKIFWLFLFYIFGQTKTFRKIGILTEICFWNLYIKSHREEIGGTQRRKELFPLLLLPYVEDIRKRKKYVHVLDVGSGPFSYLAWGTQEQLFTLVAVDPLAEEYKALLDKYKISYPIKPIKATAEDLLHFFSKDSFDIVYSRNALDHAQNVRKSIESIYLVLKQDGIFFLEGFVKEGTHTGWSGLHQHDLVPINGELFRYDKKGCSINVTSAFKCIYQEQTGLYPGDWYKIIFKK